MSPVPAVAPGAGSAAKDVKGESGIARLLGSGMLIAIELSWYLYINLGEIGSAGIAELLVFHPVCLLQRI